MGPHKHNSENLISYPKDIELTSSYKFDRDQNDHRERYPIFVFGLFRPDFRELFGKITQGSNIKLKENVTNYLVEKGVKGIRGTWNTDLFQQESRDIDHIEYFAKEFDLKHIVVAKYENDPQEDIEIQKIKDKLSNKVDVIVARFSISEKSNFDIDYTCPVYNGLEIYNASSNL